MTVAALSSKKDYLENGATLTFAIPFRFLSGAIALSRIMPDGVVRDLAAGTDFTVAGGTTDAGGTLTLTSSVAGARLRIRRRTARAQEAQYTVSDTFPAASHEGALDRQMMISQEQDDLLEDTSRRAVMVPDGETAPEFPPLAARAGKFFIGLPGGGIGGASGTGNDPALRSDLAEPEGGDNIGFRQRGLFDAAAYRKFSDKAKDRFDYRDMDGYDLTGTHGQTSVMQKFCQKSSNENEVAWFPSGRIVLDGPTPLAGGTQMWGSGGRPYKTSLGGQGPASGTIFCLDTNGSLVAGSPGLLDSGIFVRGVSTYRIQPVAGPGWEPNDYGPDWDVRNIDITFDEVCGINSTRWILLRDGNAGRITMGRVRAQAFIYGLQVEESYDLLQGNYMQFWPVWDVHPAVQDFTRAYCDAVRIFKQDGVMLGFLFSIYCRSTLRYSQNAAGKSVSGSINHLYADGHGRSGLWFDSSVSAAQLAINIYNSQSYDNSSSFSVLNEGNFNQIYIGSHHCQKVGSNAVAVTGTGNNIRISDPNVTNFNQVGDGSPAYFAAAGNRLDLTNDPLVGGSNNGGPMYGGNGDIRAPGRWVDWAALVTSQGGDFGSVTAQNHEYNLRGNLFEQRGEFTIPNVGSAANLLIVSMPFPAVRAASVFVTVKRAGGTVLNCTGRIEAGSTLILIGSSAGASPFQNGDTYSYSARIKVA